MFSYLLLVRKEVHRKSAGSEFTITNSETKEKTSPWTSDGGSGTHVGEEGTSDLNLETF